MIENIPSSDWISVEDQTPPLDGTPLLLCFAAPVDGSFIQPGTITADPDTLKPIIKSAGLSNFELPNILYWKPLE